MPSAPRSVAFWMLDSNASGMRIIGAAPTLGHAAIMRRTSSHDIVLCCISNQMKSKCLPTSQYSSGSKLEIV